MKKINRFVAPEAWFSFEIPLGWMEQDFDGQSFMFNNPYVWDGNFRISAFRGGAGFAKSSLAEEFSANRNYNKQTYSGIDFLYQQELFEEGEQEYVNHFWIGGKGDTIVECSFAALPNESLKNAEYVLNTLIIGETDKHEEAMIIPVRLSEIYTIDDAYDNIQKLIKEKYTIDFQGNEEDIANLQKLLEDTPEGKKAKPVAINIGIVLACIYINNVNEYEWCTLLDGNREAPVLHEIDGENIIDPLKLVWSKIKKGDKIDLQQVYNEMYNIKE